jgi:hypothetical protein
LDIGLDGGQEALNGLDGEKKQLKEGRFETILIDVEGSPATHSRRIVALRAKVQGLPSSA